MTFISSKLLTYLRNGGAVALLTLSAGCGTPGKEQVPEQEPIAYVGHGALFDKDGRQIVPTAEFVAGAQEWYRAKLLAELDPAKKTEFDSLERRLNAVFKSEGQARLVVRQRLLDWLVARSPRLREDGRTLSKINALKFQLLWTLRNDRQPGAQWSGGRFRLDPDIERRLNQPEFSFGTGTVFLATTNSGQAYINECAAAGVPIPPTIGQLGAGKWISRGFIPKAEQFIVNTPAEVRTFDNASGMCIALPRYSDDSKTTVALDGVICLSKTTSKVCFWDNQMSGTTFPFPAGSQIPIGVPTTPGGQYQAGGAELLGGQGGICTDCHAGENPYIVHPNSNLGSVLMGDLENTLPMFAPNRYIPLVAAAWPQNGASQAAAYAPGACTGCHQKGGNGRFPQLSNALPGYCNTILANALTRTMPPFSPGSEASSAQVTSFKSWCGTAATSTTADYGDPHLTTTNGIHYDFQAAGEFVALRNSDSGFELQTRQTPVATSFTPGPNAYTGLASCVSLNTAAAVRVGAHRVSYQMSAGRPGSAAQMQLRIDGKPIVLPPNGVALGTGNSVAQSAAGGLDVRLADGTRLLITPNFWASEGYWYLDVEVLDTPAREGIMGHIPAGSWLPLAPDGTSFGPAPGSLAARDVLLNQRFANAWRVTGATSLFDYAPGTSTANFTDRGWPPRAGSSCSTARVDPWGTGRARPPVRPMEPDRARNLCRPVQDRTRFENCVFDVTVTGNGGMAEGYVRSQQLRAHGTAKTYRK